MFLHVLSPLRFLHVQIVYVCDIFEFQLDILLNGKVVEELSTIVHRQKASQTGKKLCVKLLDTIPRQMFEIAIQAAIGSKVLARENLKAYRKDVTAKLVSINYVLTNIRTRCVVSLKIFQHSSIVLSLAVRW